MHDLPGRQTFQTLKSLLKNKNHMFMKMWPCSIPIQRIPNVTPVPGKAREHGFQSVRGSG